MHAKARGQVQRRLKRGRQSSDAADTPSLPRSGICASWSYVTSAKGMLWCKRGGAGGKGGSRESPASGHLGQVTTVFMSRLQWPVGTRKRDCYIANGLDNLFVDSTLEQFREGRQPGSCMQHFRMKSPVVQRSWGHLAGATGHWNI